MQRMRKYKNIDELFRQEISGYRSEPSAKVWNNIEAGYFQGSRFIIKWYHLAAVALLAFILGGIWYFDATDSTRVESVTGEQTISESTQGDQQVSAGNIVETGRDDISVTDPEKEVLSPAGPEVTQGTGQDDEDSGIPLQITTREDMGEQHDVAASTDHERYGNLYPIDKQGMSVSGDPPRYAMDPVEVKGLASYLKKKEHTRFYTGASAHTGIVYYPSTKDQFTWSADLVFGLKIGNFYIETGAGYESMQERGIYLIELKGFDSIGFYNRVESFEINPFKPGEIVYNTRSVTVYDSVDRYTHTTPLFNYKYVNLPLLAGYRFFDKKNLTISANTGLILDLLVSREIPVAGYNNPDYTIIRTRNVTPERTDWNLRWQLGIRLNYRLAGSLSLSAEPVFTKYLNSIYMNGEGHDVKPYTMGLRFGLFYGF